MKVKDVYPDMSRYLKDGCYCPNEIYGLDGFCYDLLSEDAECVIVEQNDNMTVIVAKMEYGEYQQVIMFWHDEPSKPNRIVDARRLDATDNNIEIIRDFFNGKDISNKRPDEFEEGSKARAINEILKMSGGLVLVD